MFLTTMTMSKSQSFVVEQSGIAVWELDNCVNAVSWVKDTLLANLVSLEQ